MADIEAMGGRRRGGHRRVLGARRPADGLGAGLSAGLRAECEAAGVSLVGGDVTRPATSRSRSPCWACWTGARRCCAPAPGPDQVVAVAAGWAGRPPGCGARPRLPLAARGGRGVPGAAGAVRAGRGRRRRRRHRDDRHLRRPAGRSRSRGAGLRRDHRPRTGRLRGARAAAGGRARPPAPTRTADPDRGRGPRPGRLLSRRGPGAGGLAGGRDHPRSRRRAAPVLVDGEPWEGAGGWDHFRGSR